MLIFIYRKIFFIRNLFGTRAKPALDNRNPLTIEGLYQGAPTILVFEQSAYIYCQLFS